jgi:hypothetical protein
MEEIQKKFLKIYILIPENVPLGFAMVAAAHAGAVGVLTWDDEIMDEWLDSFRKVVCKVSLVDFEKSAEYPDSVLLTESALAKAPVARVFKPRHEWPEFFKHLRLYK